MRRSAATSRRSTSPLLDGSRASDREMKGALLAGLVAAVRLGTSDPALFDPVLGVAGSELETHAVS
jgi:hypothetical protein